MSDMITPKISFQVEFDSTLSLAAQQNSYPLLKQVKVTYHLPKDEGGQAAPL